MTLVVEAIEPKKKNNNNNFDYSNIKKIKNDRLYLGTIHTNR